LDVDQKLTDDAWKAAQKFALDAQLNSRPNALKAELDGEAYNGLVDPGVIKTYSDGARNAIINRAFDDQYRALFLAKGKVYGLLEGLDNKSVNIVDLIAEREAIFANRKKLVTPEQQATNTAYLENLDAVISTQTRAMAKASPEKAKTILSEFDRKWEEYLLAKRDAGIEPDISDLNKELELQRDLQIAYNEGAIKLNEFRDKVAIMTTRHHAAGDSISGAMPFNEAIDKAGAISGWWVRTKGNDVVSSGYRMIKDHVDRAYPELLPEERRDIKAQMLSLYHQKVLATPEETMKNLKTQNQWDDFARPIIQGGMNSKGEMVPGIVQQNSVYKDPRNLKEYHLGDVATQNGASKIFLGLSDTGKPKWAISPESVGKPINIRGTNYTVQGVDSEGEFMLKRVKNAK
jgi:hypothetical protein